MTATIESDFKRKVCDQVRLLPEGNNRYRVFTPFTFADGDRLSVVLKRNDAGWAISDEGSTFMRLSYRLDDSMIEKGQRRKVIDQSLLHFGIEDRDGELWSPVAGDAFGDALFSCIQAVLRISDIELWTRAAVKKAFMDDLRAFVTATVPASRLSLDWHDPHSDPLGTYPVDYRIEGKGPPLFLFGVPNDDKCSLATIVILHYRQSHTAFQSLAVFEDQSAVGRKQVARLSDVVDRQFSSLAANHKQLADYLTLHAA